MAASPGENGQVYVPSYNAKTGELSWTLQEYTPEIESVTINTTVPHINVNEETVNIADYIGHLVIDSTTNGLYTAITSDDGNKWQLVGVDPSDHQTLIQRVTKLEQGSNNTNPGVACPISSVDSDDKILSLENGTLKSSLTFTIEDNNLVIKGKGDQEIITVDFSKDAYSAGNGLTLTDKEFAVDFTKVEAAGAATTVKSEIETELTNYAKSADVYSKTAANSTFVKSEGYVEYTQDEKTKLAGIATGAEVNYVKSVGDNLAVDAEGKLTVTIPEVEVPFQSVEEGDKVLTLNDGVLSSTLSYTREIVGDVDSLVLKGKDGAVIGSIPVADFIADGMLESVAPKEEGSNKFVFTFNSAAGSKSFEVDFSKYVDVYHADEGLILENNTFKIDFTQVPTITELQEALDQKADKSEIGTLTKVDGGQLLWT